MRGLKHVLAVVHILGTAVAPYVGAWIETSLSSLSTMARRSHPTWVRGLKLLDFVIFLYRNRSHPTWVRGLKRPLVSERPSVPSVAPYVGAWIETDFAQS